MLRILLARKVLVLLWRVCGCIPLRSFLDHTGLDLHSTLCPCCDDETETIKHRLITCKYAHDVWSNIGCFSGSSVSGILGADGLVLLKLKIVWQAVTWSLLY